MPSISIRAPAAPALMTSDPSLAGLNASLDVIAVAIAFFFQWTVKGVLSLVPDFIINTNPVIILGFALFSYVSVSLVLGLLGIVGRILLAYGQALCSTLFSLFTRVVGRVAFTIRGWHHRRQIARLSRNFMDEWIHRVESGQFPDSSSYRFSKSEENHSMDLHLDHSTSPPPPPPSPSLGVSLDNLDMEELPPQYESIKKLPALTLVPTSIDCPDGASLQRFGLAPQHKPEGWSSFWNPTWDQYLNESRSLSSGNSGSLNMFPTVNDFNNAVQTPVSGGYNANGTHGLPMGMVTAEEWREPQQTFSVEFVPDAGEVIAAANVQSPDALLDVTKIA
ncbi:hypothetical protein LXA43DRAFT_1100354 [Ganoderma leucocontextum]|nr:hypothetical protein LXA43DRAFT_1100354 [Ganoderma leucocontextum]